MCLLCSSTFYVSFHFLLLGFYQVFEVKLLPQSSENGSAIIDKLLSFFVSKSYGTVMASFAPLIGDQSLCKFLLLEFIKLFMYTVVHYILTQA